MALAALCASPGPPALARSVAGPVTYRLDPAHTFVTFEQRRFGTSPLRGRFGATFGEPFVGDDVHLLIHGEAIAP